MFVLRYITWAGRERSVEERREDAKDTKDMDDVTDLSRPSNTP